MLTNGHFIVIDMAVRAVDHPLVTRYAQTLVLGAFREDTGYIAPLRFVYPYLSLTHFYRPGLPGGLIPFVMPGPRMRANHFFRRAVREHAEGRVAASFVELGRVMHLLVDMACPTHAQRAIHITDPYEWYVDSHEKALRALPVRAMPDAPRASDIVERLAIFTQAYPADRTQNGWGAFMKRLGVYERMDRKTVAAQAEAILPVGAGHAASLLRLFLRSCGEGREASSCHGENPVPRRGSSQDPPDTHRCSPS